MHISERLQELRKENKYSQEQLAEKLGVTRQAISKWESAQGNPDINNIIKLSEIYNVSTDYLLKGEKTMPEPIKTICETNSENSIEKSNIKYSADTILKKTFTILLLFAGISTIAVLFILTLAFGTKKFLGRH